MQRRIKYSFDDIMSHLFEYKQEHGNLRILSNYVCLNDGFPLGKLVYSIQTGRRRTSAYEKKLLNDIGFVWERNVRIRFNFQYFLDMLNEYKQEYGNLLIKANYVTKSGVHLGILVMNIRNRVYKITDEQAKKLDDIGFVWRIREYKRRNPPVSFEKLCDYVETYKLEYGNLNIPVRYVTKDGIKLGFMIRNTIKGSRKISPAQKQKLINMGVIFYH